MTVQYVDLSKTVPPYIVHNVMGTLDEIVKGCLYEFHVKLNTVVIYFGEA